MGEAARVEGRDLGAGIALSDIPDGGSPLLGRLGEESVLLTRVGGEVTAVGATCTHYGGPLWEGLTEGDTIRCPWHHACFSLRTGEALAAPALNPLPTWDVVVRDGVVKLGEKHDVEPLSARGRSVSGPESIVIVGAGAAGSAAAEQLRREGYAGPISLIDPDPAAPYDRPNLSKDYLAGAAPEEWIPLRPPGFYAEHGIDRLIDRVKSVDRGRRLMILESGREIRYDAALLALGAVPRTLPVPGSGQRHVHVLRSLDDCRAIIRDAEGATNAVVIGAGFVGMEAASSLRARGVSVTVVAPDAVPFQQVFGVELGSLLQREHERSGVEFRLGRTVSSIGETAVVLDDSTTLPADFVVIGVGVDPDTALAESAGLSTDRGIVVDACLRTSDRSIYAAGDGARWPDPHSGRRIRVEHWVVAQRQGQVAARNMLGRGEVFDDVPFFWTRQFDVGVCYVGHAEGWDRVEMDGPPTRAAFRYVTGERLTALATIDRDRLSLEIEAELRSAVRTLEMNP